jgi:hypothetical protein
MKLAPWIVAAALGCSVDPCPDGQHVDPTGFCVADAAPQPSPEGGAAGSPSTDPAGAGGADSSPVCSDPSAFGDTCASSDDCRCDVSYCAIQPTAAEGICTRTGCVEDPGICPPTFTCFDLSVFDSSLPSICAPAP